MREALHVVFNVTEKHSGPVIFLAALHFVSEKNEDKIPFPSGVSPNGLISTCVASTLRKSS